MAGCIQNLKPWPKGVSGNPAGRPKNDISVEIARAVFENNPEAKRDYSSKSPLH